MARWRQRLEWVMTGPLCFGTFPWAVDCTEMVLCGLGATFYHNTTFSTFILGGSSFRLLSKISILIVHSIQSCDFGMVRCNQPCFIFRRMTKIRMNTLVCTLCYRIQIVLNVWCFALNVRLQLGPTSRRSLPPKLLPWDPDGNYWGDPGGGHGWYPRTSLLSSLGRFLSIRQSLLNNRGR